MPKHRLASFYTALVEFPRPVKIDCFVHNDGDRKTELLNLSLLCLNCFRGLGPEQKTIFSFVVLLCPQLFVQKIVFEAFVSSTQGEKETEKYHIIVSRILH